MAFKAIRNTYALTNEAGVEVRRLVKAGRTFPRGYNPTVQKDVEEVEGSAPAANQVVGEESVAYEDLKVDELKEELDNRGVHYKSDDNKADLIAALQENDKNG